MTSPLSPTSPPRSARRRLLLLAGSVLVLAAVAAGVLLWVGADEAPSRRERSGSPTPTTTTTSAPSPRGALGEVALVDAPLRDEETTPCPSEGCQGLEVSCPGVDPAVAVLSIQPPTTGVPRGVLVLFSGGEGRAWWASEDEGGGGRVLEAVEAAGVEVVQVRWDGGWVPSGGADAGLAAVACRPATVVQWIHDNRYLPLGLSPAEGQCGFCVAGSSGGASQAAYSLSHYGLDGIVDALVLASGPPHAAIAKGCVSDPALSDYRYDAANFSSLDQAYGAARRQGNGPCERADPAFAADFERDGVDTGGDDYVYETTRVHVILGADDPTVAPVHARDYLAKLRAEGSPMVTDELFPGMVHSVTSTPESAQAFIDAIVGA